MKLIPSNGISIGDRAEQQDDFGFTNPLASEFVMHAGVLAVVVDGMGGVRHGAESARVGKATFVHAYEAKTAAETVQQALFRALHEANAAVVAVGQTYGDPKGVGATLTAAVVWQDALHWVSVGDSALFLVRDGHVQRLTTAHEVIDPEQGAFVSSFLGLSQLTQVDRPPSPLPLTIGDRVLVCSDGLFKSCTETDMARVLTTNPPVQLAEDLVDFTIGLGRPGQDNTTALVICCEPDSTPSPITESVPDRRTSRMRLVAVAAVLLVLVTGGVYAWWRVASGQVAGVNAAWAAGDCPAVLQAADGFRRTRWPLAVGIDMPAQACGDFDKAVKDGEKALTSAATTTGTTRREQLRAAADAFDRALKKLPATATPSRSASTITARLKEAQDALQKEPGDAPGRTASRGPSGSAVAPTEAKDAANDKSAGRPGGRGAPSQPARPENKTDEQGDEAGPSPQPSGASGPGR